MQTKNQGDGMEINTKRHQVSHIPTPYLIIFMFQRCMVVTRVTPQIRMNPTTNQQPAR